ncbi:MAG: ATP synthase F1 subunit epsilon [Myxococcota bacterium]
MPFELTIVTPEGQAYEGTVDRVVLPGSEGEFGVLANHERFLSPLKIGALEIQITEGTLYAAITDGFAEVNGDEVTVLVDSCVMEHEIDFAKADAQMNEAAQALERAAGDEPERYRQFEAALEHARARVEVSRKKSS